MFSLIFFIKTYNSTSTYKGDDVMLNVLSLFSGIGSPEMALRNLGIDYDIVGFSEIDPYAIKSYCAIHDISDSLNFGDITLINPDDLPDNIDLIVHGSPCQDYSNAGLRKGGDKGSGTRSSLMWHTVDIVKHKLPKYILWENVKGVLSKINHHNFDKYISDLETLGYKNFYTVLDAKNFGVPQHRERIFVLSVLDQNFDYTFPTGFPLDKVIGDVLEETADPSLYLTNDRAKMCLENITIVSKRDPDKIIKLAGLYDKEDRTHQAGSIYDTNGISPSITTCLGGHRMPLVLDDISIQIKQATKKGYIEMDPDGICDLSYPSSKTRRGRVQDNGKVSPTIAAVNQDLYVIQYKDKKVPLPCIVASRGRNPENPSDRRSGIPTVQMLEPNTNQISNTITTVQKDNYILDIEDKVLIIRKLSTKEVWRLMGFSDQDHEKAANVCSPSNLYKQAGNSIVLPVLEHIFSNLFNKKSTL